mgnify:FL=1
MTDFKELENALEKFRDERDWSQFHTVKDLLVALSIEVSELAELTLWKSESEILELIKSSDHKEKFAEELADILSYLILLSKKLDINLVESTFYKIEINKDKYPVEKAHGVSKTYTEFR